MKKFTLLALMCTMLGLLKIQAQFTESFDVAGTPPDWTVIANDPDGFETWQFGPLPEGGSTYTGEGAAYITWESNNHDDYLITPQFTVYEGVTDQIRFYGRNFGDAGSFGNNDKFNLLLSTTGTEVEDFTVTLAEEVLPPTDWTEYMFDLSAYTGQQVYIAFKAVSASQIRLYIDDVFVEGIPTCPKPSGLTIETQTETGVTLSWTENGSATQWEVIYGEAGFNPETEGQTETINPLPTTTLSGLTPNTAYTYYVKAICGGTDESVLSIMGSFYTGYCEFTSNATDYYITHFSTQNGTENISNSNSGISPNGYGDYSDMAVTSYAGGSFDFNIGFYTDMNGTYATRIWIDFNNNMIFEESEKVYASEGYVTAATGTIEVPENLENGNYRIRVVADHITWSPVPCGVNNTAEAEDYTLTIGTTPNCLPVSVLTVVSVDAESANLSWTSAGAATEWEVLYGLSNFDPLTEGTAVNDNDGNLGVIINGLDANTDYDFYVTALCGAEESAPVGPMSFTTLCSFTTIPYIIDFESAAIPELPNCTTEENPGDGNDWNTALHNSNGFNSTVLKYGYNQSFAANAWFYTQGISLEAGTNYYVAYTYGNNNASYSEKLKLAFGTSATHTEMQNLLVNYTLINNAQATAGIANFTVEEDGVYYFGFNAHSSANQFDLFLDDISIVEGSICQPATGISVSDISDNSAVVTWNPSPSANQGYTVEVYPAGADQATETPIVTAIALAGGTGVFLQGLDPNTLYDVYVVSKCGAGGTELSSVITFSTTNTVGLTNIDGVELNYYPNPVGNTLSINAGIAITNVAVYNILGEAVIQVQANNKNLEIDTSALPAGAYILKAHAAEGFTTFKVIKQ